MAIIPVVSFSHFFFNFFFLETEGVCPSYDAYMIIDTHSVVCIQVMLRVGDAEWSDKFSLDTVGSSGNVTCKVKGSGGIMEVGPAGQRLEQITRH